MLGSLTWWPNRILAGEIVTLAELLAGAGYATMGRSNNVNAGHHFNMDQGFQNTKSIDRDTETPKMLSEFERWVSRLDSNQPFFFFMLTRDAHGPYDPKYEYYRRFARSPIEKAGYQTTVLPKQSRYWVPRS